LILREAAQCPDADMEAFTDLRCFGFFNTNNIWINLEYLKDLLRSEKIIKLPLILNPKTVDPRDEMSPPVYHIETAMGAAVGLFEGSAAVQVPKSRFFPVKKCNDLLAIRSDLYLLSPEKRLVLNPARESNAIRIQLDPRFYGKIDQIDLRFGEGSPSLIACESLEIEGDVRFERNVVIRGKVRIRNTRPEQAVIRAGTVIVGDMVL
jgi:UTP--glucose-1-phosphate uridylyltransferase